MIINSLPRKSIATLLVGLFLLTGCAKQSEQTASSTGSSELPSLYQREGELAKATEWPKTQQKVEDLKLEIAKNPNDVKPRLKLVVIYLSEARITGEHPYYYPAILKILDGVLTIDPKNFEALVFQASVKMSQHQFSVAKEVAEKARQINPNNAYVYGILVDANVELGNYDEAVKMSDQMQVLKPSLESYSRASYLRELFGDYPGSIEAMKLAVQAGLPGSEPHCWSKQTLGHLYETTGQLAKAEQQYAEILVLRPSYAFALSGQARIQKARKEYDKALVTLEKAAAIMPEFSFHEEMADIYALQGDKAKAANKYAEVAKMLEEDAQSGHTVDLELCKLHTKAGNLDEALSYGQKELNKRPQNIDVNHALADIYFLKNDPKKAQEHMKIALRTGSKDPELLKRAGEIQLALGNAGEGNKLIAAAKKTNPVL
ncbi:tetratricopeptide repeat protein [Rudanella paleaurantiibacter]|uniref:Tetratricopeptide repeat protein n=1 Tax=Rudanella paleaurantiibacter TaxID=2614655 RepID=A0A7J5TRZ7_9BACT|nr:tetratricopeptide repeat protein [Rudanella paleaurantiibacter]KAB7725588.1 tetratricopeptide repeat protein [Rudanella paleaurantiibacter]